MKRTFCEKNVVQFQIFGGVGSPLCTQKILCTRPVRSLAPPLQYLENTCASDTFYLREKNVWDKGRHNAFLKLISISKLPLAPLDTCLVPTQKKKRANKKKAKQKKLCTLKGMVISEREQMCLAPQQLRLETHSYEV